MFKTIKGAADCEIRSVFYFLNARNVLPSEIHHQVCQVYSDNATSDSMVRKWVRMFNEGQENVHDEAWSGHPSLVNAGLVRKVNERVLTTDVSQFLICHCTFFRFQGLYCVTLSVVVWVIGKCVHDGCTICSQRSTKTVQTQDFITSFKWEQMDHPPYSPDLAPSDFHLFLRLKKFLGGKRFDDDDDLNDAVQKWLTSQATTFCEEGIQKLVLCYDKCLNNGSEYVEK